MAGGAVGSEPESSDDLVEDEQSAVPGALLAHQTHVFRPLDKEARVGGHPLDDDRGDLTAAFLHQTEERLLVVER